MTNVVITGATSFIGIHLINEWLKKDCIIYAIVRPNSERIKRITKSSRVKIIEKDMVNYDELYKHIDKADIFYHLAWEGARVPYRDNKDIQKTNYLCSVKAFECAQKLGCKLFVGAGSQAEYGKIVGSATESDECCPTTEYGKEKLHTYVTLASLAELYNMRFIWTRIFSLYGKYDYPETLIMSTIDKMKRDETIQMTEGTQLWDYLYVEDAAKALVRLAEIECENGIYNIASGQARTLKEYVEEIKEILGSKSTVLYGAIPYGSNGPIELQANVTKIRNALALKETVCFSDGIRNVLNN